MGRTVMIVDDAIVIRQLIGLTLSRQGFEIIEAMNGTDALSKLANREVVMIITDLNMPEMDGLELIRNIRSQQEHRFTPIVMLTTVSQEEKKKEGQKAGASGWLLKPFNAMQLISTVNRYVA